MRAKTKLLLLKVKISLLASIKVFTNPLYILSTFLFFVLILGFLLWSLNLDLVKYIIFEAPLSSFDKLDFLLDAYRSIFQTYDSFQGFGLILFSTLFGINLSLIIFVFRHKGLSSVPKKSGIGGLSLAVLAGGCIACGTSLIAPLLATLGATSSAVLRDLSVFFSWAGSLLIAYSIYKLGEVISFIHAKNRLD